MAGRLTGSFCAGQSLRLSAFHWKKSDKKLCKETRLFPERVFLHRPPAALINFPCSPLRLFGCVQDIKSRKIHSAEIFDRVLFLLPNITEYVKYLYFLLKQTFFIFAEGYNGERIKLLGRQLY